MGVEQGLLALVGAADFGGGYEIEQSLRFDGSSHLEWTPSTSGNGDSWTVSLWYKFQYPASRPGGIQFFQSDGTNHVNVYTYAASAAPDDGKIYMLLGGGGSPYNRTQSNMRDPSAWYHLVVVYDGADGTAQQRQRFYINGVQQPTESPGNAPDGRTSTWMQNVKHKISTDTTEKFYGYMAEFHAVDGQQLLPTDFGEFDDNGVWRPIEYTGSYGTNGFYLKFDPSATNGIGHDHSGNGNNFTPTGFDTTNSTASTYDVMSDTPTTNWCTLNATDKGSNVTLSEGNLDATTSSTWGTVRGTIGAASGKWYYEFTVDGAGYTMVGVQSLDDSLPSTYLGLSSDGSYGYFGLNGTIYANGATLSPSYSTFTTGDTIGVAWDADAGKIWFAKNGTWQGSGDPAAGTNALVTGIPNDVYTAGVSVQSSGGTPGGTANFGQRDFAYTPPTGFNALNTANLPAPDIADGSQYFNTVLYTGNGSYPRAVTGAGFSPDWVWLKSRSDGYGHGTYDRVRGVGTSATALRIDSTSEEGGAPIGPYIDLDSLDTDGFTLGNTVSSAELFNLSTKAYAAWCWKAVGSGSSIAAGSIDGTNPTIASTVSANPTAGFSIVTYTGTGVNATVGHGLGVKPSFYVVKPRSYANNWPCWHKDLTSDGYYIHLNYALKQDLATAVWNGTGPSNTVFNIGTNTNVNQLSATFVAYVFAEVEGYSRISFYSGNGSSSNAPFVYCGFRPAFVLIKNYRGGSETNWVIKDTVRDTYNPSTKRLNPNQAYVESDDSNVDIDFLANGFKVRSTNTSVNESGSDYLFLAFAENPFGGSGVSPATAR